MPVHAVAGGYRWGRTGKVYRTRAAAERQARAIYVSGWNEDGTPRLHKRAELHRALQPPVAAEATYARKLTAVMRAVHRGVDEVLRREVFPAPEYRHDDEKSDPFGARFRRGLFAWLTTHVGKAHDVMSDSVDDAGERAATLLRIPARAPGLGGLVAQSRRENIELIQNASADFLDELEDILAESSGLRHEEIASRIEERMGISERRAGLIARDQTAKLAGSLNHARQQAAGITQFVWSTSRDERVRESHAELEGETCDYDDPPIVDGEPSLPTEPVSCRCVAIPVLPEVPEEEPEEERDEPEDLSPSSPRTTPSATG